jgi:hypothetical protein
MKTLEEQFKEWYGTIGIRTYSNNHGSAQGHEDYAKNAFLGGFHAGVEYFKQILENDKAEANQD